MPKPVEPVYTIESTHFADPVTQTSNSADFGPIEKYIPPEKRPKPVPVVAPPTIQIGTVPIDATENQSQEMLQNTTSKDDSGPNTIGQRTSIAITNGSMRLMARNSTQGSGFRGMIN